MIAALALVAVSAPGQAAVKIDDLVQSGLHDATFTAQVVSANHAELAKINKDFAQSYRFKSMSVRLKEPYKLRLDSKLDDQDIRFIINGTTRHLIVPKAGIKQREDLSDEPGKRQTLLDFGLLSPSLFNGLLDGAFVRTDRATGAHVFDLTYEPAYRYAVRYRVWIDPAKRFTFKREWYGRKGNLMAIFHYEEPRQFGSVWLPTRLSVRNAENKLAGVTEYKNLKVNSGLADSIFSP